MGELPLSKHQRSCTCFVKNLPICGDLRFAHTEGGIRTTFNLIQ
jgi:hypothetical protein